MTLLPPHRDFSDKDFASLLRRMQNSVGSVFPDWNDFDTASFGNILLEEFAFVGDLLSYYQDAQARESRITTATQRKNVIALAKLLGYRLAGARAAAADAVFRLAAPPAADVTIPAGTVVRTQDVSEPVRFRLAEAVTIPTGADPPQAIGTVEHAELHDELFDSTHLAHQSLPLTFAPFLDDSATIEAGGHSFAEVESFLDSGPHDRHFSVVVDQNDRATVRFGDGLQGAIPTGTIRVAYKTGGGPRGNVDAGSVVVVEGAFADAFGTAVEVSVTNPQPAAGGVPRQSLASARVRAPASLRTLNRTVSREDFEQNALRLPEVARALMLTSNEDPTIDENSGVLFIIPQGGGLPSQALKDKVEHQVTVVYPCTLTFVVSVQDPVYRVIDVHARVFLRAGANAGQVRSEIEHALAQRFAIALPDGRPNPDTGFGFHLKGGDGQPAGEVAWSDVLAVVEGVRGVRKIGDADEDFRLNGRSDDVVLAVREFPVLGSVTLENGDTGEALA
ncbi:baseplate J/gp47 family protein [Haliangium sp.]|uniref:baseplate J/gp47 family protein n=1 Tax=Haliangium sp. TaxID=2663208 RepID=UPI003D133EF4